MNVNLAKLPCDDDLIRLAAQGDHLAFAELVRRHQHRVLSLAYRFLGNRAEAEEVAQEVFLRLWRTVGRYKPQAQLGAYLRTIAANACLDVERRPKLVVAMPEGGDWPSATNPSLDALLLERRKAMNEALQSLPKAQRMAVVLFHFQGQSVSELAGLMGVSRKGAESLLSRARATLRQRLASLLD